MVNLHQLVGRTGPVTLGPGRPLVWVQTSGVLPSRAFGGSLASELITASNSLATHLGGLRVDDEDDEDDDEDLEDDEDTVLLLVVVLGP